MRDTALMHPPVVEWYRRNRARSRALFDLLDPAVYYSRPIALRNPIVFYEGHLPAFSLIAFVKRGLERPGIDERLEEIFARGIDPESEAGAVPRSGAATLWPSRDEVLAFGRKADGIILGAIHQAPFLAGRQKEGLFTALEHEAMHQETLLYMWHRVPQEHKRKPAGLTYETGGKPITPAVVRVPEGAATLGARRSEVDFGWDNEFEAHQVKVPAFEIDVFNVTNLEYRAFLEAGGTATPPAFWVRKNGEWFWRGMFKDLPLPPAWPVYVTHDEASAYARWRGRRLPTEAEYHRAAFGTPSGEEREHPWGDAPPDATRGNFDFTSWEPVPVGARPAGASAWGVHDLVGNGWEWTSTVFGPFDGFRPMASYPEYSADFFDGAHYVLKGASPATASELVRRSFRNWFRPNYPYVYATFRTVA